MLRPCSLTTLLLAACAAGPNPSLDGEARAVLDRQAACWNRGDLRGFVGSYAEDTTFLGANGLVRGATDLLAKYERGYPDAESRGTLTFEVLEVRPIDGGHVLVIGVYRLARKEPDHGYFTLLLARGKDGRLAIAHDHTTQAKR